MKNGKKSIKIVSIVWYKILPGNFGGQQVIATFNQALSVNYDLVCLCSKNNSAIGNHGFKVHNKLPINKLQFINPFVWLQILSFCKKQQATHVIIEHPYHVVAAWLLHFFYGVTIIHRSHNIEYERFKILKKSYWPIIFLAEKWISSFALINIFISHQVQLFAISKFKLNQTNCITIPHLIVEKDISQQQFAKEKIRQQYQIPNHYSILLFNGTLDYLPNAKAVENIAYDLIPILNSINKNFIILINGRIEDDKFDYLKQINNPQLILTGFVDNVADYFLAADVYINAVTIGGGVQTKTLEALSYHKNVVCFKHMLNGIDTTLAAPKIFTATNWQEFAEQICIAINTHNKTSNHFFEAYGYEKQLPKLIDAIN